MADIAGLRQNLSRAENKAQQAQAEYDQLKAAANSLNFGRDANGQVLDVEGFRAARAAASAFKASTLDPALVEVDDASQALRQAEATVVAPAGTASAGQVVAEEQRARSDDAAPQNPPSPFVQSSTGLNVPREEIETGTDGRIRTTEETQSTPQPPPQPFATPGNEDEQQIPFAPTSGGAGARKEDSGTPTRNSTRAEIDNVFNRAKIVPQPNVLDQYASYTYTASMYLLKPEDYNVLINQKKKIFPANQLLFQSAGAPTAGRNSFFSDDFYIDKFEIKSVITGKGTNSAHGTSQISMTVIEPNGITLLTRLDKAVQAYLGSPEKKKSNFGSQIYLLVIRFYGYDDQGNLVRGGIEQPEGNASGSAFVEKFYPMTISTIKFKVANKLVEYEITGTSPSYQIATGSNRGTIPYNVELGGITVKDALTGPTVITPVRGATVGGFTAEELNQRARANGVDAGDEPIPDTLPPPPPNAATAPNPKLTIRQGLMTALNQYQQDLVNQGIYTYPDTYSVEFINTSIEQAKIQVKNPDKSRGSPPVKGTAADQKNPAKQSYDPTSRIISVTAGMQIVQFIDQVVRNSTFVTDQALVRINEISGRQEPNGTPGENVAWYKISLQATPKPGKYDPKTNDYAYDIKYVISIYRLSDLISNYFQVPRYNGVHKQYNYWFTGENTQVLNYEQTYNSLYTATLSGQTGQLGGTVVNDAIKANFQPRSGENSQGAAGRVNEIGANAADYLFNPSDLAKVSLSIVGDPAWLQQGEAFALPGKAGFEFNPFLADGTINFEAQQILFEILINTPGDYDLDTGIIDPNTRETIFDNQKRPGATRQSYVYIAHQCVSEFNKGKFVQNITGSLLTYLPDQTFKEQQALGRPTGVPATETRNLNNPRLPDNEWTNVNGLSVLTADLPTEETDESVPISLNSPQPQPSPEPPSSDGDISPFGEQNELADPAVNSQSQLMDRET